MSRTVAPPTPSPQVTAIHGAERRWQEEFAALREICLASGLREAVKWGKACYDLDGGNVVLIHGFKDYCALLFMKGALLDDPEHIFVQQTPNVRAVRQIRFESAAQIVGRKVTLKAYLRQAISVEKSGAKVPVRATERFPVPAEFQERLDRDPWLAAAFRALTAGRQRGYLLHFAGAKQSATRATRVAKHAPRILQGLGLDD